MAECKIAGYITWDVKITLQFLVQLPSSNEYCEIIPMKGLNLNVCNVAFSDECTEYFIAVCHRNYCTLKTKINWCIVIKVALGGIDTLCATK